MASLSSIRRETRAEIGFPGLTANRPAVAELAPVSAFSINALAILAAKRIIGLTRRGSQRPPANPALDPNRLSSDRRIESPLGQCSCRFTA